MRRGLLLVLVAALLLTTDPANAQMIPMPPPTTLVEGLQYFYPGGGHSECFDMGAGVLAIDAVSPDGRTGEAAYLEVFKMTDGANDTYMKALISDAENAIAVRYTVQPGVYCYDISVTKRLVEVGDPNRPERPTKQVWLKITHQPWSR